MVFCVAIMILGVIGNIMVPIVILKTKDMRNSTNIFLINLSVADLLVLLVCTPTVLVEVYSKPEIWVLGKEMCKAVPFVELTVAHASVLTILAISFERYYAICEPLKAGYVCTKARALLICLAAWAVAALFTSPILLMADYHDEEYVNGTTVPALCLTQALNLWTMTYFLMIMSAFFLLPLIILIILYAIIAKKLISKDSRGILKVRPNKPELSFKARKQVVMMLGAVVLSFFLCLLPFRILTLWIILVSDEKFENFGSENYYTVLSFSRIMFYLNSAINPILYNLMSSKFRKGFRKLCFCVCCQENAIGNRHKRTATLNTTTTTFNNTTSTASAMTSKRFSSFLTHTNRKHIINKTLSLDDLSVNNNDNNTRINENVNNNGNEHICLNANKRNADQQLNNQNQQIINNSTSIESLSKIENYYSFNKKMCNNCNEIILINEYNNNNNKQQFKCATKKEYKRQISCDEKLLCATNNYKKNNINSSIIGAKQHYNNRRKSKTIDLCNVDDPSNIDICSTLMFDNYLKE